MKESVTHGLRAPFSPSTSSLLAFLLGARLGEHLAAGRFMCTIRRGNEKTKEHAKHHGMFFQVVHKENDEVPRMRIVQKKSPVESKTCMGLSSKLYLWSAEAIKIWSVDRRGGACVSLQKVQLTVWFLRVAAHSNTRFLKTYVHLCPSNSSCASSQCGINCTKHVRKTKLLMEKVLRFLWGFSTCFLEKHLAHP